MIKLLSNFQAKIRKRNEPKNYDKELSISDKKSLAVQDALVGREIYKTNIVMTHYGEDTPKSKENKERYSKFTWELYQYPEVKYYALIELWEENDEHNGYLIIEPTDKNIFEKVANTTNTTFENINKIKFLKNYVSAKGIGIQEPCGSKNKEILGKENIYGCSVIEQRR